MYLLVNLILGTLIVLGAAYLLPGVSVSGFVIAACAAVLLSVLYGWLVPFVLTLFTYPSLVVMLLVQFLVLAFSARFIAYVLPGFNIKSFGWACAFAGVIIAAQLILGRVLLPFVL